MCRCYPGRRKINFIRQQKWAFPSTACNELFKRCYIHTYILRHQYKIKTCSVTIYVKDSNERFHVSLLLGLSTMIHRQPMLYIQGTCACFSASPNVNFADINRYSHIRFCTIVNKIYASCPCTSNQV